MRLALISQTYPPMVSGLARAVCQLAEGLAGRGHEVAVLTASELPHPYRAQRNGVSLIRLRSHPTPLRVGQRWCWWRWRQVASLLASLQLDLVHLHDPSLGAFVIPRATEALGLPLVITAHALPRNIAALALNPPGARRWIEDGLWAIAARRLPHFDAVVAPSAYVAEQFARHAGATPVVISNGVDLRQFRPEPATESEVDETAARFGLDPARPVLLHVGRLDHEKRVEEVVQACAQVIRDSRAQLIVAGDGNARGRLERLARRLGVASDCRFPGFIAHDTGLPSLYRLARVFVIASRIEAEGLVVLEAAACGCPIVAVRATTMPELVECPGCGLLVEPGDVPAMASAIQRLLSDGSDRAACSQAGPRMAEAHSRQRSLDLHEALYQRLIQPRSAPTPAAG